MAKRPAYHKILRPAPKVEKYLGELEAAVMAICWRDGERTVHDVVTELARTRPDRPVAYTTAMTVMTRLAEKGLLHRTAQGRRYAYRAALSREAYLGQLSARIVDDLVADFGDVALAHFAAALGRVDPARLAALARVAQQPDAASRDSAGPGDQTGSRHRSGKGEEP